MFVSAVDLQKARRNAKRSRAFAACVSCKSARAQCSDYRPCKRCAGFGKGGECVDQNETNSKKAYRIEMTNPFFCPLISQNPDSAKSSSLSAIQNSLVQNQSSQESVLQSATNDFMAQIPSPDIKRSRQTAALHTSAQPLHGIHLPFPFSNPKRRSEPSSGQATLYRGTCSYAATPGEDPVSSIRVRSFNDLKQTFQAEDSQHGKFGTDQLTVPFVSRSDAHDSLAQTSHLSFTMPTHQQAAALKRDPVSFQLTDGLHLSCSLSPHSLRSEPAWMSVPLALSHGRSSAMPSSSSLVPYPSINLLTPQTMPRGSPSPADLLAVERLRLLLAIAASGSTPAPAMALPSVPSRWPSAAGSAGTAPAPGLEAVASACLAQRFPLFEAGMWRGGRL